MKKRGKIRLDDPLATVARKVPIPASGNRREDKQNEALCYTGTLSVIVIAQQVRSALQDYECAVAILVENRWLLIRA